MKGIIEDSAYNWSISACRFCGTLMIIICHFGTAIGNSAIGQAFQVGVQLFLFISGYLYALKKMENKRQWIKGRFLRISIPCYIFIIYASIVSIILFNDFDLKSFLLGMLNLQGYHHVFVNSGFLMQIPGTSHLWFVTVIFICYLFTIVLRCWESKILFSKCNKVCFFMVLLCLSVVFGGFGIRIDYLVIYTLGYFYAGRKEKQSDYFISVLLLVVGVAIRLLMKGYCDANGDTKLYLYVIIPMSYNLIAFWVFKTISLFEKIINMSCRNKHIRNTVLHLDGLSFYIYITHYQFIDGPFDLLGKTGSLVYDVVLVIGLTIISAELLSYISSKIVYIFRFRRSLKRCNTEN